MFASCDKDNMLAALRLAAGGEGYVEPNPMVGARIVGHHKVLGEGFHRHFGGPHAEVAAIRNARESGHDTTGAELFVTLEPCAHHGKTPPCTDAVIEAGLKRVIIAAEDPGWADHAADGCAPRRGIDVLRKAGIGVEVGLCRDAAVMLNAAYYKAAGTKLPLTIAKWAMSADGKIATRTGSSRWISCPQSRSIVHELRGRVDAVIIGVHTAICDNPSLTCRNAEKRRTAERIVLCGERAPAAGSNLVRTAGEIPLVLAFPETHTPPGMAELERMGCEPMPLPGIEEKGLPARVSPTALLHALFRRGAANVLVEGGSSVLGCFLDAGLLDKALVFMAPFIVGGREAVTPVGGHGAGNIKSSIPLKGPLLAGRASALPDQPTIAVQTVGKDILLEGWVHDPRSWHVASNV